LRAALAAILVPTLCVQARPARAGLNLLLNEFTATRDELQAELARRFPIARRYGELASVSLHDPQLALAGGAMFLVGRATPGHGVFLHLSSPFKWGRCRRHTPTEGSIAAGEL